MKKPPIYIIGVAHEDLEGRERLQSFLNYVKPNVIGIEYTKKRLEFVLCELPKTTDEICDSLMSLRKEEVKKLNYMKLGLEEIYKNSNISDTEKEEIESLLLAIKKRMSSLYEVEEPFFYYKSHQDCTIEFIDLDFLKSQEEMESFSAKRDEAHVILEEELKADGLSYQEFVDRLYGLNRDLIEKIYELDLERKVLDVERNDHMASMIRQLVRTNPNKIHVYIVGILHLYALADRLSDLYPIVMTLPEAYKMNKQLENHH